MVKSPPRVRGSGDAVWIDLDPQAGREQAGRRPAVVLSPAAYNGKVGLALLCPITRRVKGYPFEVGIPRGLPVAVILADQVKGLDWHRRDATLIAALPPGTVAAVLRRVNALLTPEGT